MEYNYLISCMTNRKHETMVQIVMDIDLCAYAILLFSRKNNSLTELYQKSYLDLQNIPTNSAIYLLSKAFPRKCKNLSRIVEHYYGLDKRVCRQESQNPSSWGLTEDITILMDVCKFLCTCNITKPGNLCSWTQIINRLISKKRLSVPNFEWKLQEESPNLVFFLQTAIISGRLHCSPSMLDTLSNESMTMIFFHGLCPWLTTSYLLSDDLFQMSRGCNSTFFMVTHLL